MAEFANAIGLLTLTVGANFTGDLFGCGIKKELVTNPLAKHGMAYLLLLFFVILTNKDSFLKGSEDNAWITFDLLYKTIIAYIGFIAFTKCPFNISVMVIVILLFVLFMEIEKGNKDDKTKDSIEVYKKYAVGLGVGLLVYGVYQYYNKQVIDHAQDFTWYKFALGTTKCSFK